MWFLTQFSAKICFQNLQQIQLSGYLYWRLDIHPKDSKNLRGLLFCVINCTVEFAMQDKMPDKFIKMSLHRN